MILQLKKFKNIKAQTLKYRLSCVKMGVFTRMCVPIFACMAMRPRILGTLCRKVRTSFFTKNGKQWAIVEYEMIKLK